MFCLCAHVERKWAGRRSNPRYLIFSQALYRLSYRPKFFVRVGLFDRQEPKKKARRRYDTGPCGSSKSRTKCHNRLFFSLAGA
jgi:hypothetical protein